MILSSVDVSQSNLWYFPCAACFPWLPVHIERARLHGFLCSFSHLFWTMGWLQTLTCHFKDSFWGEQVRIRPADRQAGSTSNPHPPPQEKKSQNMKDPTVDYYPHGEALAALKHSFASLEYSCSFVTGANSTATHEC